LWGKVDFDINTHLIIAVATRSTAHGKHWYLNVILRYALSVLAASLSAAARLIIAGRALLLAAVIFSTKLARGTLLSRRTRDAAGVALNNTFLIAADLAVGALLVFFALLLRSTVHLRSAATAKRKSDKQTHRQRGGRQGSKIGTAGRGK
jgi:hypothetical protein